MKGWPARWRWIVSLALLAIAGPAAATGVLTDARPAAGALEAGRKIYNFRCYFCHGYSGDARTLAAGYLKPKPRAFTSLEPQSRSRAQMIASVRDGHAGTAMKGFAGILDEKQIGQVVDFVRDEFIRRKAPNSRYHTVDNGWPDHGRNRIAFPFATGEIPLDRPWEELDQDARRGRRLFLASCVSCHDNGGLDDDGPVWEGRPLSYPRNQYVPGVQAAPTRLDAISSASPYLVHDVVPEIPGLSAEEKSGEALFQQNCAFCHGADGTGRNWIGSFMEPHPRNLNDPDFMATMTRARLADTIREGLPGTSMPAWRSVLEDEQIQAIVAYVARAFHPLR